MYFSNVLTSFYERMKYEKYILTPRGRAVVVVSTSACHAAGRGSILGTRHVSLLGVKTWLSTLEIVYLCVFRRRH